jgi:hypothetical protein
LAVDLDDDSLAGLVASMAIEVINRLLTEGPR